MKPHRYAAEGVDGLVHVDLDGGRLTSDGGVLRLAAVEERLDIADRLARCIEDPRPSGSGTASRR